jgi:hypothetical protein
MTSCNLLTGAALGLPFAAVWPKAGLADIKHAADTPAIQISLILMVTRLLSILRPRFERLGLLPWPYSIDP